MCTQLGLKATACQGKNELVTAVLDKGLDQEFVPEEPLIKLEESE